MESKKVWARVLSINEVCPKQSTLWKQQLYSGGKVEAKIIDKDEPNELIVKLDDILCKLDERRES